MTHPANPKKISEDGLQIIRDFEGLRLTAYQDDASIWTIGYGTTAGVRRGMVIDKATAEEWLKRDVEMAERAVARDVDVLVKQNQFDAMVSLVYNIGIGGFHDSTVLRKLNEGDDTSAGDAFLMWIKVTVGGKKVRNEGLFRRRKAERLLFFKHLMGGVRPDVDFPPQ